MRNAHRLSRRAFIGCCAASLSTGASAKLPPYGALPSPRQLRWHKLERYAFLHFGVNTFTGKEWGYGDEDPSIFNPTAFDADAIVEGLKAGGLRGAILTAKHHDGFCLWPTRTTEHCIRNSKWRGGKGDVVRDIAAAARRHGLLFGVYLSPWDRNNAAYGTAAYPPLYRAQLRELLTQYGPIFEVWHDGANGGDGYYGGAREKRTIDKHTYYDWPRTWDLVRSLQPKAVIFSDVGPDIRWVGNERGYADETCWETFDPVGQNGGPAAPGDVRWSESGRGTHHGSRWLPPECDVSIRPGWFWHASEDARVKTPADLFDLYYRSVGRGASLLLNVPPDRRGQLADPDLSSLRTFGTHLGETFATNLATPERHRAPHIPLDANRAAVFQLREDAPFNVVRLREDIRLGQRVDAFELDCWRDGAWSTFARATTIGPCRLVRTPSDIATGRIRLRITETDAPPALSDFGLFREA
jgi:alpha-L-fucosidase